MKREDRQIQGERIWQGILNDDVSDYPIFSGILDNFNEMTDFFSADYSVAEVNDELFSELLYKSSTDEESLSRLEAVFADIAEMATKASEEYNNIVDEDEADEYSEKAEEILERSLTDSLEELCRKEMAQ
tara:strand:+ start:308 stop:697 length:390 start_codon:yes stop_codon:yes gene_type:complete